MNCQIWLEFKIPRIKLIFSQNSLFTVALQLKYYGRYFMGDSESHVAVESAPLWTMFCPQKLKYKINLVGYII